MIKKILRFLLGLALFFILLIAIAITALRFPYVQDKIVAKAVNYVTEKTGAEFQIKRLFITYDIHLQIEGLLIQTPEGDSLTSFSELEAGVHWRRLLKREISLSVIRLDGLHANIKQYSDDQFNFSFLIDAFSGVEKPSPAREEENNESPPWTFSWTDVLLTDLNASFSDHYDCSYSARFEQLFIRPKTIDWNAGIYHLQKLNWESPSVEIILCERPKSTDTTSSKVPINIQVDDLHVTDFQFHLNNQGQLIDLVWENLRTEVREVDLSIQDIDLGELHFTGLDFVLNDSRPTTQEVPPTEQTFELPDWRIYADNIDLAVHRFEIWGISDTATVDFSEMELVINDIRYEFDLHVPIVEFELKKLFYRSKMLPTVDKLQFSVASNEHGVGLHRGQIQALKSSLQFEAGLQYSDIAEILTDPQKASWYFSLDKSDINTKGLMHLISGDDIPEFIQTSTWHISINAEGKGTDSLQIRHLSLRRNDGFFLDLRATASNPADSLRRHFHWDIRRLDLKDAFLQTVKSNYAPEEDNFPTYIALQSRGEMKKDHIAGSIKMQSNKINLLGDIKTTGELYAFEGEIDVRDIALGENTLNTLHASIKASSTTDFNNQSEAIIDIDKIEVNEMPLEKIAIDGKIRKGIFNLSMESPDENAALHLEASGTFDSIHTTANFTLDLRNFNAHYFKLTDEYITAKTNMRGSVDFVSIDDFHFRLDWDSLYFQQQHQRWDYKNVYIDLESTPINFALDLNFQDVQSKITANAPVSEIKIALTDYIYGVVDVKQDSTVVDRRPDIILDGSLSLYSGAVLELLGDDYRVGKDTLTMKAHFHETPDPELMVHFSIPDFSMPNLQFGNLSINLQGDASSIHAELELDDLTAGGFDIGKTKVISELHANTVNIDFTNWNNDQLMYRISTKNIYAQDSICIQIDYDSLILNQEFWSISKDNKLVIKEQLFAHNWEISYEDASVSITTEADDEKHQTYFDFKNFNIGSVSAILNTEQPPVEGFIGGKLQLEKTETTMSTIANIQIDSLKITGIDIGSIDLLAERSTLGGVELDFHLEGEAIVLDIDGSYIVENNIPIYDLGIEISRLDLSLLEAFGGGILNNTRGSMQLTTIFEGFGSDYRYGGSLRFNDAGFTVVSTNSAFTLSNERITIADQHIRFQRFTMLDKDRSALQVNGNVSLENITNPAFDLSINADKFSLLHSTRKDNDLFFGDLLLGAKITIGGDLTLPELNMKARLLEGTNVTFIVPESEADVMDRKSVVQIVDRSIPDSLRQKEEPSSFLMSGILLDATLEADPSTTFKVIIDEQAGDMLEISGEAKLSLQLDASGQMQLAGLYRVTGGFYQLNFYDLVQRRFIISPESTIRWNGDPLMADLNLEAIYNLKTPPLELMIDQIGPSRETQQPYRREQPFEVKLKIGGELLQPQLAFDISMPETARGAVNGTVYSRIQQLRQDENELNQQTFSLLVLNQFMPSGQGGQGAGASGLARSSASRMLSQQLNQLSGKYIKGVDLDLGLDSYTDYESGAATDRTDLQVRVGKTFLDNRLKVQVGGQFEIEGERAAQGGSDQFMGDVSIEYTLTEDGRYLLRAFRRNDWQGAVEGQITTTGTSVVFSREFDTFEELVKALWKGSGKKEDTE